jgi:rubredoxin
VNTPCPPGEHDFENVEERTKLKWLCPVCGANIRLEMALREQEVRKDLGYEDR